MEGHSLPHPKQPDWVRLNVQEWLVPHLKEAYGEACSKGEKEQEVQAG